MTVKTDAIQTTCAVCGTRFVDDLGGRVVPLCSSECETAYESPEFSNDPRSDEFTHPDGNEDAAATDRYILCHVKVNGVENGRTEILDTTIDGGEGNPLIVASFFDRHEAIKFCKSANAVPKMLAALKHAHRI